MTEVIRRARPDELMACAELYERVVTATFTWFDLKDMQSYFLKDADQEEVYVAVEGDRILGLAAFYRPEDFLHSLYVDVGQKGRGVGLRLLRHIDSIARRPVSLKVQMLNFGARRFYAREGFKVLEAGGAPLPSKDRWLRVCRAGPADAPSPEPRLDIEEARSDEDLDLCAALYEHVAARHAAWEPAEFRTASSKRASFDGEIVLSAKEHGVLAGFAAFTADDAFVHSLFVEPQGHGTGPALLRAVGRLLGRPFQLHCDERNTAGLRFYERNGFTRIGVEDRETYRMIKLRSDGRWV